MSTQCVVSILVVILGAGIFAQQSGSTFDVVSVKLNPGARQLDDLLDGGGRPHVYPGGRFQGRKVAFAQLVSFAYDVRERFQVEGWPEWADGVNAEFFDIDAKAANDAPVDQIRMMVRSLLADRFKLVAHTESREIRVQALVLARPDGSLGPALFRMDGACPGECQKFRV